MNPKVVLIVAPFPMSFFELGAAGRGGGQQSTWLPQMAQAWEDAEGVEIHWCVLDRTVRKRETERHLGQVFHRVPDSGVSVGLATGRWRQRRSYGEAIRAVQPDVIHCFGTETMCGAALWEFGGPSILSMQGVVTACMRTGDLTNWHWKVFRFFEPRAIKRATIVTSESEWGMEQVRQIVPGTKTRRIKYGVSPSFYDVEWNPDPGIPRVFFAGALSRLKGVDILVEMLRRHPERSWTMAFAGGGAYEEPLRALNDPKVEVLGVMKTAAVQEQMAKAWGLVLASRADTSPNVVKEARVIGLPIVVSPNGGHAEYLEDGEDGLLVDSEDPDAWFRAIDDLCSDFERCRRMGGARREHFREHFRPGHTARAFVDLYREMGASRESS